MSSEHARRLREIAGTNSDVLAVVPDWRLDRLPPDQRETFFNRAQQIFTPENQDRISRHIFTRGRDTLVTHQQIQLAHDSLSIAILGIDSNETISRHRSVHTIERRFPDSPMIIKGEVFSRPGAPFSADFISAKTFDFDGYNGRKRKHTCVTADGATMMMSKEYLEKVVPDMVETCSFTHEGKTYFRPDIFWRVALGAILGDVSMPTPREFIENPKLKRAFEYARTGQTKIPQRRTTKELYSHTTQDIGFKEQLMGEINEKLWNFMLLAFPQNKQNQGFTEETFHRYPSGVFSIMVYQENLNSDAQKNTTTGGYFAVTGDVGVGVSNPKNSDALIHGNDINIVQIHDDIRMMTGLNMNTDQILDTIARYRVGFTGNFPQPPNFLHLMLTENFSRATPIIDGPLWTPGGPRRAVAYTDGLPLKGLNTLAHGSAYYSMKVGENDWIATLLSQDPYLAVLDSLYNRDCERDLRKPDDMAYIILADQNDLPHPEYLFTPLLVE